MATARTTEALRNKYFPGSQLFERSLVLQACYSYTIKGTQREIYEAVSCMPPWIDPKRVKFVLLSKLEN
jgi:hypothetical protein